MAILIRVLAFQAMTASSLQPGLLDARHLLLLFNRNSQPSGELAVYYASCRGIPQYRLIGLDLPLTETLSRHDYDSRVVEPIRTWFGRDNVGGPVACMVTFYDVPIRVGPQAVTPEMRIALGKSLEQRTALSLEIRRLMAEIALIVQPTPTTGSVPTTTQPVGKAESVLDEYRRAINAALQRASNLIDPQDAASAKRRLLVCMERMEGVSGILLRLRPTGQGDDFPGQAQLDKLKSAMREAQDRINALLRAGAVAPEREEARALIRRYSGMIGLLMHLDEDIQRLKGAETGAALDNELATLWSPPAGLYRWRINPLNVRERADSGVRESVDASEWQVPAPMIGRLDGPSPQVVRRMIDDAVSTEKVGLKGHIYIDARGLPASDRPGSYGLCDQNLRELAGLLSVKTRMPVVLDDRPAIFEIGACPDTAVYCGWYRVGRYQPSFRFVRGAVAVHIASNEAKSLRDPQRPYWCKELLADGAAATFGPVDEPYLSAFPFPKDFFGLLMTGKYTLAECYWLTNPYTSWNMMLLGDPLYRPFAVNPQLKVEDVLPAHVLPLQPIPTSQPGGSGSHRATSR